MRLAIFTHVIHKKYKAEYYAYSPYVREINLWIKNADEVEVLAPLIEDQVPDKSLKYIHYNLKFLPVPSFDILSIRSFLKSVFITPLILLKIISAMYRADHLHIRCPGNIGLLASLAQIFFPKKPKTVKYAGNWDPKANQPWSYNFQKWILRNRFLSRNINVLVYGNWSNENRNIQSFYTASFSEKDKLEIKKDFSHPFEFMYAGNLVKGKGIFQCIDFIGNIKNIGYPCSLKIYGDGILMENVKEYIHKKNLCDAIILMGRKNLNEIQIAYKSAHFIILLSESEGWPKALAEGMWHGAVPISTKVSCIPWMLDDGDRGVLIERNSKLDVSVDKLKYLLQDPEKLQVMSKASMEWAQKFTLEKFERDINKFL